MLNVNYSMKSFILKLFLVPNLLRCARAFVWFCCLMAAMSARSDLTMIPYSSDLDYGIIANENGICRMNDRGSLLGLSGQSCLGSGDRAVFNVQGQPGSVIHITVSGSGANGVTFTPKISGSSTKVIAANGGAIVVVAGDLQLNNAQGGKHALDYIICVHHE